MFMLGISLDMGAVQPRRGCKEEHYKKIYSNYVRLVKINFFKACLCAYSFIQMFVGYLGHFHCKSQKTVMVMVINNNTIIIWGNIR